MRLFEILQRFGGEESGQDLVEYALIAALIAVACVGTMKALATAIGAEFGNVSGQLT